ncbi:MAG: hypothetical protein WAN72_24450 [Candidatus Acidiferrales bacterium]
MKNSRWLMGVVLLVMCAPAAVSAQSTAAAGASQSAQKEAAAPTPVKLEIVLSEYDGAKKISSLAYTLPVIANGDRPSGAFASLRVGVRVPVTVADEKKGGNALQYQYIDVGTNIDARVAHADDGRYQLDMTVDRSSLYVAAREQGGSIVGKEWSAGDAPPGNPPMVRQYRGGLGLFVREGQATEATVATDPVTGHVLKVEVTLSVVK